MGVVKIINPKFRKHMERGGAYLQLSMARYWIQYWTRVRAALANLHQDTPLTLRHRFWPQTRVDEQSSEASQFTKREFDFKSITSTP